MEDAIVGVGTEGMEGWFGGGSLLWVENFKICAFERRVRALYYVE